MSDNDWHSVTQKGDAAIQTWIDDQLSGRSCAVVLIGSATAGRKWIKYEIAKSWNDGKGLVGVHIHNLKNAAGQQATKGSNPFADFTMDRNDSRLSGIVRTYDPPYSISTYAYEHIKDSLADWVEEAIMIRNNY